MKRQIFFIMAILFAILVTFLISIPDGVKYSDYEYLKTPRFVVLPDINAMQVKTCGDPAHTAPPAIKLLHKTYRKLTGVNPSVEYHMPIARWYFDSLKPSSEWEGRIIIPVPDSIEEIPEVKDESGLKVELAQWKYGEVAEILHVGSYDMKAITHSKLLKFIESQGYEIRGPLEEQYIKGSEGFWPVDPADYLTIIRYQVKRN